MSKRCKVLISVLALFMMYVPWVGANVFADTGPVRQIDGLRVVELSGTAYEMGYQHGTLLQDEVHGMVSRVLGYFRGYLKIPFLNSWLASQWLERSWWPSMPFIPEEYLEELRGLADASGVPLIELYRLHAVPDRTYSCANFVAWGPATSDRRLIHGRNLDWNIKIGIQDFATVFVVRQEGKGAFINIGWAGMIGVLTGISDAQISIGQIGAETKDTSKKGMPMVFIMRRVLEDAETVRQARELIASVPRTVGTNYIVADAIAKQGLVIETTANHERFFQADDPIEHGVFYARPLPYIVFRADTAMDAAIRDLQIAANGNPDRPGLEDPAGSSAYDVRYLGQAKELERRSGDLDLEGALEIMKAIAPSSNVQSVIFSWPDVLIANAQGMTRAAWTRYHRLNAEELLGTEKTEEDYTD